MFNRQVPPCSWREIDKLIIALDKKEKSSPEIMSTFVDMRAIYKKDFDKMIQDYFSGFLDFEGPLKEPKRLLTNMKIFL